jgi:dTDP-4-amino-4,6-dideoxygalactose transaminase
VDTILEKITTRTRAIVAVDLFGYPINFEPIMRMARERGISVVEDAAQAPGATRDGRWAGTQADVGVFSLNYHKTIHTGEGGVAVTNDERCADRLRLIRNHAEAVVREKGTEDISGLIGFNYRMTEIEAAIGSEQLKKLEGLNRARQARADQLIRSIDNLPGITAPKFEPGVGHGRYLVPLRYDASKLGIKRSLFAAALRAEGLPVLEGYVRPLYLEPMYQRRIAFGNGGFPFSYSGYKGVPSYDRGACPVAERMHFEEVLCLNVCHGGTSESDISDAVEIFIKVIDGVDGLRQLADTSLPEAR